MFGINGVVPRPDIALGVMQELTNLDAYVAHRVLPIFPSSVSTGSVPSVLRRREVYRIAKPKHGGYTRIQAFGSQAPVFNCQDAGLEEPLDAKDAEVYGGMQEAVPVVAAGVTEDVLRSRDASLATVLFSTGTFGTGFNTAATAVVGTTNSKVVDDVSDGIEKVRIGCGMNGNRMLISAGMLAKMRKDPQVQARYRAIAGYTEKAGGINLMLSPTDLAAVFGVEEIIVGGGVRENADEGQTRAKVSVWADTFILVYYQPPLGSRFGAYLGRTFLYEAGLAVPNSTAGVADAVRGLQVETYDDTAKNVGVVRVRQFIDMLLLNIGSGHLITGA